MKNLFCFLLLISSLHVLSQSSLLQRLEVRKELMYVTNEDETITTKYSLSNSIEVSDISLIKNIVCEIIESPDPAANIVITSLNILTDEGQGSEYSNLQSSYFIEDNRIYFFITPLDHLTNRRLKLSAYDTQDQLIESACYSFAQLTSN